MLDKHDKRKFQRIETNGRLNYRPVGSDHAHEGRCLNLSGSGLLFQGPVPAEIGHALEISVLPENRLTPPLDALAEVIRCTPNGDGYEIAADIKGIKGSSLNA